MGRDRAISRSSSPLSFPPSPSQIASSSKSTKKNVAQKAIHPFKKARTVSKSSNASIVSLESGISFSSCNILLINLFVT